MPTALSCKSASALDSLPRNTNARRSGTALHRLQQQRLGSNSKQGDSLDSFGLYVEDGIFPGPESSAVPRRKISNKFAPRRRKSSQKSSQAIASNDLPLASSDLYSANPLESNGVRADMGSPIYPSRDAFSDGEEEGLGGISEDDDDYDGVERHSIRVVGIRPDQQSSLVRSSSLSPRKLHQPRMKPMIEPEELKEEQEPQHKQREPMSPIMTNNVPSTPTKRRQQSMPARKRIITKNMIGKPTNFQHTGHIGASSYGGAISMGGGDAEMLRQQLSEVAAALKLDDGISSMVTSVAPSREPSKGSSAGSSGGETAMTEELAPMPMPFKVKDQSQSPSLPINALHQDILKREPELQTSSNFESSASQNTGNVAANKASGVKRTTSKRKPVPAPRNLADLYSEFTREDEPVNPVGDIHQSTPLPNKIMEEDVEDRLLEEEVKSDAKPIPTTIRANGKRMVEGPAGDYITETANVRWNKALNEIALALKDDGDITQQEEDDDQSIQKGLQRADEVLRNLDAI